MKYTVMRTDTADAGIRKIILYIARKIDIISSNRSSFYFGWAGTVRIQGESAVVVIFICVVQ